MQILADGIDTYVRVNHLDDCQKLQGESNRFKA